MIQFMKTGLRLFALCATLLVSITVKAQISRSWHYYTNDGVKTTWGGARLRLWTVVYQQ